MSALKYFCLLSIFGCALALPVRGAGEKPSKTEKMQQQIEELREEMERRQKEYEKRLQHLQKQLDELSGQQSQPSRKPDEGAGQLKRALEDARRERKTAEKEPEDDLERALVEARSEGGQHESAWPSLGGVGGAIQSMNPEISAIVDTFYHADDAEGGIESVFERMDGFGHGHNHGHDHEHGKIEDGFNMRHLELAFTGDVDPYFQATAIAAISEHGAEMEEAYAETLALPAGLKVKAGKFFSDFGRINSQHSHEWDFVDKPLIYRQLFGTHNLNEKGAQLSWLAPTPFYLKGGVEAFQGDNHLLFDHHGGERLPDKDGPRALVEWLKFGPNLSGAHGMELGLSHGHGIHQEVHDANLDGLDAHWLDGRSQFWGTDAVYKYDASKPYGQGDVTLQAEYLWREKDLDVEDHLLMPGFIGRDRVDTQDGFYLQGTYGFAPRWRAGLRWDRVGLTNESEFPTGLKEDFDESDRLSAMVDFWPSHFSLLRLQVSRGDYAVGGDTEDVWEVFLQLMISLGSHGAHEF